MIKLDSNLFCSLSILICLQFTPGVYAQTLMETGSTNTTSLKLVQTEVLEPMRGREAPENGALLLPERRDADETRNEKQCMTVCNRWGEDCIYDPQRGRQCRRTCKDFEEQCFKRPSGK